MIYLDNAATTFPKPEIVYESMDYYIRNKCVNAGRGSYKASKESMALIEETRSLLGEVVNLTDNKRIIFSSSATIAINQILNGLDYNTIQNVFVTPFEHNAIMRTLYYLKKRYKFEITVLPFDNISFDLDYFKAKVLFAERRPDLLIMTHVSNVTGYILPINKLLELNQEYNAITLIDCAQSLGLVELKLNEINPDFIVFAGHKSLYGPMGIAGYINNSDIKLNPYIIGGTGSDSTNLEMPKGSSHEAGTYNSYAIAGLNASLKWIKEVNRYKIYDHEKMLSDKLIELLNKNENIELYIPKDTKNHIGVVAFNIKNYKAEEVAQILDEEFNICVRAGHHCAPNIGSFLDGEAINGTVRVSVGYFNSCNDVEFFCETIKKLSQEY